MLCDNSLNEFKGITINRFFSFLEELCLCHNLCHKSSTWQVMNGRGVMVGLCGDNPLPFTTRHVGELWHKLCHFMWH